MDWRKLENFSFGDSPDLANRLLEPVLAGEKTATCWAESEGPRSAEVGKMMVVLDGQCVPKAVLKTTGGGTLGCNWQGASPFVFGIEGEGGHMKVSASAVVR
jgi:uncharacterized protein YhfF